MTEPLEAGRERMFKCDLCGGIFDKEWTDEEATTEREKMFGGPREADDAEVCDGCYMLITGAYA